MVLLHLLAAWMSEKFYRTFRPSDRPAKNAEEIGFDALITQRNRTIGVFIAELWTAPEHATITDQLGGLLTDDMVSDESIEEGAYAVWVPPKVRLPSTEPYISELRLQLLKGMRGISTDERREIRIPRVVTLAKLENTGAYMSVTGGFSTEWLALSDGVQGSFHLDSHKISRLPKERAELESMMTQIRDRAMLLREGELTELDIFDHWTISHLPETLKSGVAVISPPPELDPHDGTPVRRDLRRLLKQVQQSDMSTVDMKVLVVTTAVTHIDQELVTTAIKGMSPSMYGMLDLIVVVADGELRQVLQPRSLPWSAS
tara:strand:- start:1148 stop:2095 length:948 start_codon:yes stop_codon:yes gene_type:complete